MKRDEGTQERRKRREMSSEWGFYAEGKESYCSTVAGIYEDRVWKCCC
jgi:hypothetical protein